MPQRTVARRRQREFFADLSELDDLVLTTKNGDPCALNIHGCFELFDKHWATAESPKDETMLALKDPGHHVIPDREPRVHFHIDWRKVRFARIQPRRLDLINSDYEIVLCSAQDSDSRIFWFYLRESVDLLSLRAKWSDEWIDLSDDTTYTTILLDNERIDYLYI